jgi:hypothetical protein
MGHTVESRPRGSGRPPGTRPSHGYRSATQLQPHKRAQEQFRHAHAGYTAHWRHGAHPAATLTPRYLVHALHYVHMHTTCGCSTTTPHGPFLCSCTAVRRSRSPPAAHRAGETFKRLHRLRRRCIQHPRLSTMYPGEPAHLRIFAPVVCHLRAAGSPKPKARRTQQGGRLFYSHQQPAFFTHRVAS